MSYRLAKEAALREERIQACMARTDAPYPFMRQRGYCEALIDGEDAVALAGEREKRIRQHLGIEQGPKTGVEINALYQANRLANERIIKQMEQKKMTRDEAVNSVDKLTGMRYYNAAFLVDALVVLGLIKFEEPKSAEQKASEVMKSYLSEEGASSLLSLLNDAGLKIVEK